MDIFNSLQYPKNKIFYSKFIKVRSRFIEAIEQKNGNSSNIDIIQRFFYKLFFLFFLQNQLFLFNDHHYLKNNYQHVISIHGNYYNDFLRKSFNNIFDNEINSFFEINIIPNEIFIDIFGLLEEYQWAMNESIQTNDEKTLTPDILGYLFENAMDFRMSSHNQKKHMGIFYSPKIISSFITKTTLELYLLSKVNVFYNKHYKHFNDIFLLDESEVRKIATYLSINIIFDITILDNACGSGEFLVTAFYMLFELWTKVFYYSIEDNSFKDYIQKILYKYNFSLNFIHWKFLSLNDFKADRNWQCFIKWIILTHNIYGVDIDKEALEITKIRLWFSILNSFSPINSDNNFIYRFLSILDNNIRLGNSLIGYGLLEPKVLSLTLEASDKIKIKRLVNKNSLYIELLDKQLPLNNIKSVQDLLKMRAFLINACFNINSDNCVNIQVLNNLITDILYQKVDPAFYEAFLGTVKNEVVFPKSFHWTIEYPNIITNNGFDIIIGNPPYITLALGKKQHVFSQNELNYFRMYYPDSSQYKGNLYSIFIERSMYLLKKNGILGFIIPNTFLLNVTAEKIRKNVLEKSKIRMLLNIKDKIFEHAEIGGNAIIILSKDYVTNSYEIQVAEIFDKENFKTNFINFYPIKQHYFLQIENYKLYTNLSTIALMEKITKDTKKLGDIVCFYQGIITGNNSQFITNQKLNDNYKPIVRGKDIQKYSLVFKNRYILFDKTKLWSNTNEKYFLSKEKIISRQTGDKLIAVYDDQQYYSLDSTHIQILKDNNFLLKYILALFNSALINFYYKEMVQEEDRPFAQVKIVNLKKLPIKILSLNSQQSFVKLVDQLLYLYKTLRELSEDEQNTYKKIISEIRNIENTIDELVYNVYELTEDEIQLLEK